jgi:hypothetical protein
MAVASVPTAKVPSARMRVEPSPRLAAPVAGASCDVAGSVVNVPFPFSARPRVTAWRLRGAVGYGPPLRPGGYGGRPLSRQEAERTLKFSSAVLDEFSYINKPPRRRTPGSGVR